MTHLLPQQPFSSKCIKHQLSRACPGMLPSDATVSRLFALQQPPSCSVVCSNGIAINSRRNLL